MAAIILLVDADLIDRADWQALLQFHGYRVLTAQTGGEALEKCAQICPDLVMIDLGLPDIPGHELSRRIKQTPRNAMTPVVFVGPYSERFKSRQRGGEGSSEFKSPVSREEAFYRVQSILGGSTGLLFESERDPDSVRRSHREPSLELKR